MFLLNFCNGDVSHTVSICFSPILQFPLVIPYSSVKSYPWPGPSPSLTLPHWPTSHGSQRANSLLWQNEGMEECYFARANLEKSTEPLIKTNLAVIGNKKHTTHAFSSKKKKASYFSLNNENISTMHIHLKVCCFLYLVTDFFCLIS